MAVTRKAAERRSDGQCDWVCSQERPLDDYGFTDAETAPVGASPVLPTPQYDLMTDLLDDMFKVYSDIMRSETLRIQERKTPKFGYLPMMVVASKVLSHHILARIVACM